MLYGKTSALMIAVIASLACTLPVEARVNQRQDRQSVRIVNGVENGSLTEREAKGLAKQQAHIAAYEARSRADGPGMTKAERVRIENMQDRASHNIHRQKHDRKRR